MMNWGVVGGGCRSPALREDICRERWPAGPEQLSEPEPAPIPFHFHSQSQDRSQSRLSLLLSGMHVTFIPR